MPNAEIIALNAAYERQGAIIFEASPLGGLVARLTQADRTAMVALQGAQVLSWTQAARELLWLSPVARLGSERPVRGGIPVCWPWFGPHASDRAMPAHGFVRTRLWGVRAATSTPAQTMLRLGLDTSDANLGIWPHQAEVELTVTLDDGLSLALTTCNTGAMPLALTQALHTYFRVGDIAQASVRGLEGQAYIDKLDNEARKVQAGAIAIDREVDRIYQGDTRAITLHDGARGQRIAIESQGSRSAVVWNPWDQKTARLGDMGAPDAYREMLCVETANAGDDVATVQPGATHVMGVRYRVRAGT